MKKWILRIIVLAILVVAFWLAKSFVFVEKPTAVTVVEVGRGRVEQTVSNSRAGTVKAKRRAKLSPEIGGMALEVPYREGDSVSAGSVVLRLDDASYRARLALARRDLDAAEADRQRTCLAAERAAREVTNNRRLSDEGIVSTDLLDQFQSNAETAAASCRAAQAGVARAEAAVRVSETELRKTVVRAPFDAVVAELSIEVGEWTTPSPPAMPVPPVVDLIDRSSIYISAPMDEVDSARIRPGQPARVSIDSHPGKSFPGTVERVAPYVMDAVEQNRTVEIEVELDDSALAASLLPGTSADVELILEVREDVLRIPTATLLEGSRVLTVEGDSLTERKVELGLRNWDFAEVVSGLESGDQVVDSLDRAEVEAGALVEIENAGEPAE